eukprot:m.287063 g.287063  ORF g.287063 m.287063 type:complete len:606 (-) comp19442_c3_seq4:2113-3930(-)
MATAFLLLVVVTTLLLPVSGLDNGVAIKPPLGWNNYMAGGAGEAFFQATADFFASTGMQKLGFKYINSDEGWETMNRDNTTGKLQWDKTLWPSGLPTFIAKLKSSGFEFGIYGAASGVTCGRRLGSLHREQLDAQTFASWGVAYVKSDNCASYAMDSTVRFAAFRDALNRTGIPIVYSIEPFSIAPGAAQGSEVANLWRVAKDIRGTWAEFPNRADISDKWAPLAGAGGWNDPDMINVGTQLTLEENRAHYGLWALMKAPLLLSSNLTKLPQTIVDIISNSDVVAINQDQLGIQGRKAVVDGSVMPWWAGLTSCDGGPSASLKSRAWPSAQGAHDDVRLWQLVQSKVNASVFALKNTAANRCLSSLDNSTATSTPPLGLLPCSADSAQQQWFFVKGHTTVTAITNVANGLALAATQGWLFAANHSTDPLPTPDASYGIQGLALVALYDEQPCTERDCQDYDPAQMWYYDPVKGFLRQSTFVASINHCFDGSCYELTNKIPTWQHHCLAHVLSVANMPSPTGTTEVWSGPLAGGDFVLGLFNRDTATQTIVANFQDIQLDDNLAGSSTLCVTDVWSKQSKGTFTDKFQAAVAPHDLALYRLSKQCP